MASRDNQLQYYENLERISHLHEKGLISSTEYTNEIEKIKKSRPKPASKKAQVLKILITLIVGTLAVTLTISVLSDLNDADLRRNQRDSQQKLLDTEQTAIDRQRTIDDLSPKYCGQRQATRVSGMPDGFPVNDGSGWTNDECSTIVSKLYDLGSTSKQIQSIVDAKIWVGMSIIQLAYSIGDPNKINTNVYGSSRSDQWVYGNNYVYVEDGVVTAYQI